MSKKRGLDRLSRRELDLLNKEIKGKRILSFYASNGDVINSLIPTCEQVSDFMKKNKEVFALDGHCLKRKPSGPEAMYKYLEKHCINSNMRYAIQEEKMKLNDSVRQKIFNRDGKKCNLCGSTEKLCIDHIFPVSRGGFTVLNNLQVLCEKCNLRKNNKI
ncbi:MAG: HNH endonuclease [Bacteroides uniformis]|mgnify:CR=1 FL=1|jgi:hypothetical protein|nr:HNH endonuclease [Bacteroides uniformis]